MAAERAPKRRRLSPRDSNGASIPGFAKWDLEQDYEQRRRKNKTKDESTRLPIKKDGRLEQLQDNRVQQVSIEDEKNSFLDSGEEDETSKSTEVESKTAPAKPRRSSKEEIRQAKEELARIAGLISEGPEEHVGLFASLAQIADSENVTVKKLALGTQLAVYKDIIPGYRIRPLSRDDMLAKLSKDVKKLRSFEQSLLGGYKDYVQTLSRMALNDGDDDDNSGLSSVAVSCTCALLTSVPHFNCRNELIGVLVRKVSTRSVDVDVGKCREALEQLFRDDEEGHASLEAVSQLSKVMKSKIYNVHEGVLNTFLHLRLLSEFAHKASTNSVDKDEQQNGRSQNQQPKRKKEFRTKRERKVVRERNEVEKEMKEADAVVGYEERDKNQAETLKLVFVAYFRILKARTQHLMGAVLEGLAKYAHLINQEFFGDVLEALKDLVSEAVSSPLDENGAEDGDAMAKPSRNATRESLLCTITAFALLQGQHDVAKSANTLHLDLSFFVTHLYRSLLPLAMDPDIELSAKTAHLSDPNGLHVPTAKDAKVNVATTTVLLLRSLQAALLPSYGTKMVPPVRIAAFVKQLLTSSLHLPQKSTVAILNLLQQVTKIHGAKIASLWNTEERKGDGVFDGLTGEVEAGNPFAATVWEGELLSSHFDPRVREAIRGVEGNIVDTQR